MVASAPRHHHINARHQLHVLHLNPLRVSAVLGASSRHSQAPAPLHLAARSRHLDSVRACHIRLVPPPISDVSALVRRAPFRERRLLASAGSSSTSTSAFILDATRQLHALHLLSRPRSPILELRLVSCTPPPTLKPERV